MRQSSASKERKMKIAAITGAALLVGALGALAQTPMAGHDMAGMDHAAMAGHGLTQPGQGAFGAIQEVVEQLEANPNTDWSHVDIGALRDHLIDMDEVTLHAAMQEQPIPNGMRYIVTGAGRTRDAIQRMVIGHAQSMGDAAHWTMTAERSDDGAIVIVTAKRPSDLTEIRALGLLGMMADGGHHQIHHWFLATGEGPMGRH
jgi:hypothetical protein